MNSFWALLHEILRKQLLDKITRKTKLHTYVTFKNSYEVESYVMIFMNSKHRSYLAQNPCRTLAFRIEIGSWETYS